MKNSKNTLWFRNFPHGRFGNAVFQYLFARYAEKKLNCQIVLGDTKNEDGVLPWTLFNLENYSDRISEISGLENVPTIKLGEARHQNPQNDIDHIVHHFKSNPGSVLIVEGYFQYDTHFFFQDATYADIFREYFYPESVTGNAFQKLLANYAEQINKALNGYLIALHIRRGDYLDFSPPTLSNHSIFYPLNLDAVCAFLLDFVRANRIKAPLVYVASDDLSFCESYFSKKNINIITRDKLLKPEQRSELNELMIDLSALSASRLLISSNSSFSMIAALLNKRAKAFVRQTSDGRLVAFDPTETVVLFGN